jgi:hypothetical protein
MKLAPNFAYSTSEKKPDDQTPEQARLEFQSQLESDHIEIANSVNATIDDESYFTRERMTSFTWINGRAIWKKTISGVIVGSAVTPYPHGITPPIVVVVEIQGTAQNAFPLTGFGLPLPYLDPTTLLNSLGLFIDNTNVYINAGNNTWNGYLFSVTIYYTKN